jgi:ribose transport system ATP-binding protein/rhamnose transport system ATP-binding protein
VTKSFPGVVALKAVSFDVYPGEIHALVGENGAGKSTLMKIVAGLETPDEGAVLLNGVSADVVHDDGRGRDGVGMVHQERSLVETLTVAENVYANNPPRGPLGFIHTRRMVRQAAEIFARLEEPIDSRTKVQRLSPAQQQMAEIAKALAGEPRVLILDEPTAALTMSETEVLFHVLRRLRAEGVAIVYISHRLAEVFEIGDRVTVLKDGEVTGSAAVSDVDEDRLIHLMVGRELSFERARDRAAQDAPVLLEVEGLASAPEVSDVSFRVRRGEIVCLAGLIGAGRSEACEAVFGVRKRTGGTVRVSGRVERIKSPADARRLGLAYVPEDRKSSGLFLDFSIVENIVAANLESVSGRAFISKGKARSLARETVERLGVIAYGVDQTVGQLSGGNQQKVLLGRWLATDPKVLIVDEPTRGVDVGARAQIYELLRGLARNGLAVVVVSSDLPEVLTLAHRIVVVRNGRTAGELDGATATEEEVVRLATTAASHERRVA